MDTMKEAMKRRLANGLAIKITVEPDTGGGDDAEKMERTSDLAPELKGDQVDAEQDAQVMNALGGEQEAERPGLSGKVVSAIQKRKKREEPNVN